MAITPLFSESELDTQIAAYKAAMLALATAAEYTYESGGVRRTLRKVDLPEIRAQLLFLQGERVKLAKGCGTQYLVGRPAR